MSLLPEVENGRLAGMPPAFKSRDSLYRERGELIEQMTGISPKLELYAKLNKRVAEIDGLLGGNTVAELSHARHEPRGPVTVSNVRAKPKHDNRNRNIPRTAFY
jgi:hypothetical protein